MSTTTRLTRHTNEERDAMDLHDNLSALLRGALATDGVELLHIAVSERQRLEAWWEWLQMLSGQGGVKHVRKFKTQLPNGSVVRFAVAREITAKAGKTK